MRISLSGLVALPAAAILCALASAPLAHAGEARGKAVAIAADKLSWEDLAAKGVGVMVADVEGHHAKGPGMASSSSPSAARAASTPIPAT